MKFKEPKLKLLNVVIRYSNFNKDMIICYEYSISCLCISNISEAIMWSPLDEF